MSLPFRSGRSLLLLVALAGCASASVNPPAPSTPTAASSTPDTIQVTRHASRFGAYTLVDPTVITVSSRKLPNREEAPLETVFHEASHAMPSRTLWHALLFFTTGEVVRHHLGEGYVPPASPPGAPAP